MARKTRAKVNSKTSIILSEMVLVRFTSIENRDKVLMGGSQFFDKKPLMIKVWSPDMDLSKEVLDIVPLWIQLHKLDIKDWGERSLFKIAGQIWKPIKTDQTTQKRERLTFARNLVEASFSKVFPHQISFLNERNEVVQLDLIYDWKPENCEVCKSFGHVVENCRKVKSRQTWRQKKQNVPNVPGPSRQQQEPQVDRDGFRLVHNSTKKSPQRAAEVSTSNIFQILAEEEVTIGNIVCEIVDSKAVRGENPPVPDE
ncbi:uncharacterized protein LOC104893350 [Beta vulgaris subsp. vulgaris]|uniref:uncharacterized protein LOC104893350 n=1 Tax=Beta vulgaris subsp. vulgaris TaxID=3555 RepID=UPI00053FAEDB|nr:uncharacterized protein LOC104893350 [Beta vulgaris subsp. vulgaris]